MMTSSLCVIVLSWLVAACLKIQNRGYRKQIADLTRPTLPAPAPPDVTPSPITTDEVAAAKREHAEHAAVHPIPYLPYHVPIAVAQRIQRSRHLLNLEVPMDFEAQVRELLK